MPQPVDLQTEMGRLSAAERIQQIADRASLAAQQRTTDDMDAGRVAAEEQVQETLESESEESEKVNAESHRKNPFLGRRRRRGRQSEDSAQGFYNADDKEQAADDEGQGIDISV